MIVCEKFHKRGDVGGCRRADETEMSGRPGRGGSRYSDAASGLTLAFEFVGAVFIFWLIGRFVDNWLGTEPWGQVVGSLIGWAGGFLHVYYWAKRQRRAPDGRRKA